MTIVNVHPEGENDPALIEALKNAASPDEMVGIRNRWLIAHGATTPDNSGKLNLDNFQDPAAAAGSVSRTVTIAGRSQVFTAGTILDLERAIGVALQAAIADGRSTQPRGTDGKFVSRREMNPAEKVELDLRFRRGEINAADYLKQSGELETAFSTFAKDKLGVDLDQLATDQQTSDTWRTVTEQWLRSPEGSTWEGGDENLRRIMLMIEANGLEYSPSVQTLNSVVNFMRQNHLLVPYEGATQNAINKAQSVEEINSAARASLGMPPRNSNLWGR
jgi:hypothetical protein